MKKILSRIFSLTLIAATVASPAMAQTAKKVKAQSSVPSPATMTIKDVKAQAPGKDAKSDLHILPVREAYNGLDKAKSGKINRVAKAPAASSTDVPNMKGVIGFNNKIGNKEASAGYYEIAKTATSESDFLFAANGGSYGAVAVDGVLYTMYYQNLGFFVLNYMYAYDIETQELLNNVSMSAVTNLCPAGMVVDPTSGDVYGIGYNAAGNALQLSKFALTPQSCNVTTIGALDGNWNSIVCDAQGQLYGISYVGAYNDDEDFEIQHSYLNKIDKTTAAVTQVGETGLNSTYMSSACIDTTTGRMFWNVCFADETSCIAEVNLTTGAATTLYTLALSDEIFGLTVPAPEAEENAPDKCQNFAVTFNGFDLSGNATVLTPATYYGGGTPSGTCTVHVLANGEEVGTLSGVAYDTEVTVPVTVESAGSYTFKVYASNEAGGDGPKKSLLNVWVGPDTPAATKATLAYVNGNMEVTWNEVTASVNGGSLPAVTYTVKRADGTVAAEGLTTTTFTEAVAEPEELTNYYYEVYVVVDDLISAAAKTNTIVLGSIVPPYTSDFGTDGLAGWTVLDANGDGKTWAVSGSDVRYTYNSSKEADDWLFTPPMKLEAGKSYLVTFSAHNNGASYPETLEVKYGTQATAAGMTKTLVASTKLEGAKTVYEFSEYLTPDESGTYYVGFHAISEADMWYLYLSNVTVEAGVSANAPGAATNIVITPDASGAAKANVSFTAPTKTLGGGDLSSITKIEVLNGTDVLYTFNSATPGATMSCDVTLPANGEYEFTIIAYNEEGAGVKATESEYIGFNVPEAPETVTIARTATDGEVTLSWDAVTKDINGLTYPSAVTYNVYQRSGSSLNLLTTVSGTTYTYQAVQAGQQQNVQCVVAAVYDEEEGSATYSDMIPVGTPYTNYDMTFAGGNLQYNLMYNKGATEHGTGGASLSIASGTTFSDLTGVDGEDDGFLYSQSNTLNGSLYFMLGMINTTGLQNPGVSFYTYNLVNDSGNADINEVYVYARKVGETEWTQIFGSTVVDICGEGNADWCKANALLTGFENSIVEIRFETVVKYYTNTMIDNIKVGSSLSNDLVVKEIQAPSKVKTGNDYLVDVTIANDGALAADSYSVELYADGDLVDTKTETNLAANAKAVVSFERTMSAIATEPVTYMAKVVFSADENVENNQSDNVTVTPVVSTLPTPTDLSASTDEQGVVLTWNEPNLESGVASEVTDDFEDADAFANEYGDWIFVDMDDSAVGGFQGTDVPGITVGETKGSFWIWDASQVGNESFAAHSGNKYLFALFRYDDGTTDDWAISPELTGDAQTISFYAKSYSASYPEKIKIMYSNGSTDPADFTAVEGYASGVEVPNAWTLYEATLPAGAKRFAINSCATSSFMLMVDDVTYTPAGNSNVQLKGYNVYRDGVKINTELLEDATYTDTNVEEGKQYTYVVTAVYEEKGESSASNEVVVTYSGVNGIGDGAISVYAETGNIVVLNAEGLQVTVASVDGAVVFDGVGEAVKKINVANGVYVVKAGNVVRKLQVK